MCDCSDLQHKHGVSNIECVTVVPKARDMAEQVPHMWTVRHSKELGLYDLTLATLQFHEHILFAV